MMKLADKEDNAEQKKKDSLPPSFNQEDLVLNMETTKAEKEKACTCFKNRKVPNLRARPPKS